MTRREEMLALADPFTPAELAVRLDEWASCQDDPQAELVTDLRRAAARLRHLSAQAEPGYVVKPLEWTQKPPPGHDREPLGYWAAGIGGHYKADRDGTLWMAHDAFVWEPYETQKAAKAAAQADFEQRIRSAITSTVGTAEPGYVANQTVNDLIEDMAKDWLTPNWHRQFRKDCERLVKAAIAALPAPATASAGWQPIETAPKDGTDILLAALEQTYEGQQVAPRVTSGRWTTDEECREQIGDCGGECRCPEYRYHDPSWISWDGGFTKENPPTHWMPLPAAPTKRSATDPATAPEGEEVTADALRTWLYQQWGKPTPLCDLLFSTYKITKRSAT